MQSRLATAFLIEFPPITSFKEHIFILGALTQPARSLSQD